MVQTSNVAKRQKTDECTSCVESVLINSDSLFKIASYLPADGLLNLALTCRRFGITPQRSDVGSGDDSLSLVEETARRIVQDIATEEEKNALPGYDGDNWLSKYNYLQSLRIPLVFDQLVGPIGYVEGNKSRVANTHDYSWATAFSNNIMMAGKHYVSFEVCDAHAYLSMGFCLSIGVMRPGEAMQNAEEGPLHQEFYNHFTQRRGSRRYSNTVNCCMYSTLDGSCLSHDWSGDFITSDDTWDGMERLSHPHKVGLLLDLDEGSLSVYINERKLGVMKRGLAGHYCWVVSLAVGTQATIKRETVPS